MTNKLTYTIIGIVSIMIMSFTVSSECSEKKEDPLNSIEWLKYYFRNNYQAQTYNKFSGKIKFDTLMGQEIIFLDSLKVTFSSNVAKYKELFTSGFISCEMLGAINDTINITSITNITTLVKTKKQKRRFEIVFFPNNWANPHVILIELTNKNSTREMEFELFIKEAELTFVSQILIII